MSQFIIYESYLIDHWIEAEIVGETSNFWVINRDNWEGTRRIKKASNVVFRFPTHDLAKQAAQRVTQQIAEAKEDYERRKAAIIAEASSWQEGEE